MLPLKTVPVVLVLVLCSVSANQRATPPQADNGFAADRLARIDRLLQQHVDENRIAGAVALVLRDGRPVYERAFGWSDAEARRQMTVDTIFRIASQSKALTSVAILSLMEEGRLSLTTPVGEFIPGFARTTVAVKMDTGIATVPHARLSGVARRADTSEPRGRCSRRETLMAV